MNAALNATQLQSMVQHWLATPACAYLGSPYGHNLAALLQQPMQGHGGADAVIAKLREDIPVLAALPPETINIYATDLGNQPHRLLLEIAGQSIPLRMEAR